MSDLIDSVNGIKTIQDGLVNNKVANFAYTENAYTENNVNGVTTYSESQEQNVPVGTPEVMNVNPTILTRGYRASASSLTRMLVNHFLGRISYNLNKVNDNLKTLTDALKLNLGSNVNFATLDATGRIPFSQLPESAVEYKGNWNASENTTSVPYTSGGVEHNSLMNGWGTKGDFWICNTAGWFKADTGEHSATEIAGYVPFLVGDRIIYDGVSWSKNASDLIQDSLISAITTWSSNKIKSYADGLYNALSTRLTTLEGKHIYLHNIGIVCTTSIYEDSVSGQVDADMYLHIQWLSTERANAFTDALSLFDYLTVLTSIYTVDAVSINFTAQGYVTENYTPNNTYALCMPRLYYVYNSAHLKIKVFSALLAISPSIAVTSRVEDKVKLFKDTVTQLL